MAGRQRSAGSTFEGAGHQSPQGSRLPAARDPLGELVLLEHVQVTVRSEATLEKHRFAAGLTQRELARRTRVPHHRSSDIESGCANPALATLGALAGDLGVGLTFAERG